MLQSEALLADQPLGLLVDMYPGQQVLVADAAAGIPVLRVDQLLQGRLTVTDHVRRPAAGRGYQLAVDHQQTVVLALDVFLDHHRLVAGVRSLVAVPQAVVVVDVGGHTTAVVAHQRFHRDRVADVVRRRQSLVNGMQIRPLGTGMPASPRICLVQSLSSAMPWPMTFVRQVTVA